ncbi:uncharacterized protein LOC131428699 [Malaya genurostris]|uniref:uncharacterized protein LOC131428699 n=1 Tax=Malaya genurostris TaxID=325434 RepID=UPI0026F3E6E3|nr:uncharacterized protein LOC131428699 [Malaya genurostris]
MANDGKYVRLGIGANNAEDESIFDDSVEQSDKESATSVTPCNSSTSCTSASDSEIELNNVDIDAGNNTNIEEVPLRHHDTPEKVSKVKRIERMEKMIAGLNEALRRFEPKSTSVDNVDNSWNVPNDENSFPANSGNSSSSIRWDHMKPFSSGISANKMWEEWNRYIENFEIAASLSNVCDAVKRTQLLFLSMGNELQEIIKAAKLRPSLKTPNCYKLFVSNIKNYFRSMTDTAAEHEAFSRMKQESEETAVAFHARLMCKVRLCNYSIEDEDRFVRAQLLNGLRNREIVKQARTYGYETNFIVQSATRNEAFEIETRQQDGSSVFELRSALKSSLYDKNFRKRPNMGNRFGEPQMKQARSHEIIQQPQASRSRCTRCFLFSHRNGQCPALKRNCNRCGKRGHFVAACRQRHVSFVQNERNTEVPKQSVISDVQKREDFNQEVNTLSLEDVLVDCSIGSSSPIKFLIDSGADVNVIGGNDWKYLYQEVRLGLANLEIINDNAKNRLHAYGACEPMHIKCTFKAKIEATTGSKPMSSAIFHVILEGARSLLGRSTASDLGLLQINSNINHCKDDKIFPKMPGVRVAFSVNKNVPPTKSAYYNIPAAYRDAARQRLHEMQARGIIEKITSAPNWISGMSAVAKGKNDFRLVVNMRAPNRAINREYYRLPLLDEMRIKLNGAKYFSKLDISNAFYHLELAEESRDMTTFLAEDGMYRFTRLMFGVNCAPEIFQREMVRILKDVDNIIVFIDDILIFADTLEKLRATVNTVLQILRKNNLTLNTAKCEFDQTRIKFLGHELDSDGFHIDNEKIKSVRKFREPTTLSELRSFLGLASFLSPYLVNFANISSPLWTVTSGKTWSWGPDQSKAFEELKSKIINCTLSLGFFSENDNTILYTDASPVALGAVLTQENENQERRIISFASKALTSTEKTYPQNQREALGAVWAVEHFSHFLLGRHFTLRTDAQGVTFILNRSREESKRALNRADGWSLRLSPYNYKVEFVRGIDNIADSPSRLYQGKDEPFNDDASPWEIATLEANPVDFLTIDDIKYATSKDEVLLQVISALESGVWHKTLQKYHLIVNDLTIDNGILIKTGCAIIPKTLQERALEIAHRGHPSIAKMKSIMRQRVWWSGMSGDIKKWVDSCKTCCLNGKPERPPPMKRVFAPKVAWESIAIDFNGPYIKFGGILILVIVDYRSRFIIARPVKSTKFECIQKVLDNVFEKEGYPKTIRTDNGPPFCSEDFANYCKNRDITLSYSTPLFPQQNGLAESCMKLINKAMSVATLNNTNYIEELSKAINAHNAAEHSITCVPPEEVMYGRKIKRELPLLQHRRSVFDETRLEHMDREKKLTGKLREDIRRGARKCTILPGDEVVIERQHRLKGDTRFSPTRYTVIQQRNGSLVLNDGYGKMTKRHVSQTKKIGEWRNTYKNAKIGTTDTNCSSTSTSPSANLTPRPCRTRKTPAFFNDYIRNTI